MSKKQLDKETYAKFFTTVNKAMTERTKGKVTLADVLKRHDVDLGLPAHVMEKIKPGLEVDLNAPIEIRRNACAACAVCSLCVVCGEINDAAGIGGLAGAASV